MEVFGLCWQLSDASWEMSLVMGSCTVSEFLCRNLRSIFSAEVLRHQSWHLFRWGLHLHQVNIENHLTHIIFEKSNRIQYKISNPCTCIHFIATTNDMNTLLGPVASYLTNKLGWRLTTVIGSVIGGAGLMLSAVAPSVYFLYFSAGVLIGLGLGIIYLPRLDCITQYWDKKRPFVTGIAICGSGIGTFIFAPLTDWYHS